MNTHTHTALFSATALLSVLSVQGNLVAAAEHSASATITSKSAGFISPSSRRAPGIYGDHEAGFVDALCAYIKRKTGDRCAPTLRGPSGPFSDTLTAGLPHLRLTIVLRQISNVTVAGSGVDLSGGPRELYSPPQGFITITSPRAGEAYNEGNWWFFPLPAPGETWSQMNDAFGLFEGLILNGCAGAAATFDLHLQSTIWVEAGLADGGETIGGVNVDDSVTGPGYYNFKYTIRATDPYGNVSDFTFSGDADSLCTASTDVPPGY